MAATMTTWKKSEQREQPLPHPDEEPPPVPGQLWLDGVNLADGFRDKLPTFKEVPRVIRGIFVQIQNNLLDRLTLAYNQPR